MGLTVDGLVGALAEESSEAGITIRTDWEPLAGAGAPVKPAVYAGGRYQFGERWWGEGEGRETVRTVSLDNVPSQANRLEAALKAARGRLGLPELVLDLSSIGTLPAHLPTSLSSFDLPHRNADAYLRDAELDGKAFLRTPIGEQVFGGSGDEPDGVLAWMPQAFLFGFWQSHLGKKRQQTKWPRTWTSELFGVEPAVDVERPGRTLGTKGDPLNLSIESALEYDDLDTTSWEVHEGAKKKTGGAKASEALSNLGHGQVPFDPNGSALLGVSCRSIHQLATVSFAGLRRLRAPAETRALLVALGLAAHQLAFSRAVQLRSGCELRPVGTRWVWLGASDDVEVAVPPVDELVGMVGELGERAAAAGSPVGPRWETRPVVLQPQKNLVKVIAESWPLEPLEG